MNQDESLKTESVVLRPRNFGRMTAQEIAQFIAIKRMNQEIIHAQAERRMKISSELLRSRITY
jgi:hypothetical protein